MQIGRIQKKETMVYTVAGIRSDHYICGSFLRRECGENSKTPAGGSVKQFMVLC